MMDVSQSVVRALDVGVVKVLDHGGSTVNINIKHSFPAQTEHGTPCNPDSYNYVNLGVIMSRNSSISYPCRLGIYGYSL